MNNTEAKTGLMFEYAYEVFDNKGRFIMSIDEDTTIQTLFLHDKNEGESIADYLGYDPYDVRIYREENIYLLLPDGKKGKHLMEALHEPSGFMQYCDEFGKFYNKHGERI